MRILACKTSPFRLGVTALLTTFAAACSDSPREPLLPNDVPPVKPATPHADLALFTAAARTAWTYVDREYHPKTGLINSVADYQYATVWDIASGLAALYCAHRLGLLAPAEYETRMVRSLVTLRELPLYQGTAFNKNYSTLTGRPAPRDDRSSPSSEHGFGWSATDLGRLLIWLKIIAENEPRYAATVRQIVNRIDFRPVVAEGYLWGTDVGADGRVQRYFEGRLGYEQYAASGYALWGQRADKALSLTQNTLPISVLDVPLLADRRGHDHLTSEPFVLAGLELGWDAQTGDLSRRVLQVQEERHRRTGQLTIVSEDHIPLAPHYFYYYTINYHGNPFAVAAQGLDTPLENPRWVSAKAAFGWHALLPSSYTRLALNTVAAAEDPTRGWGSGVYEGTATPTGSLNINTAAVILEAALFSQRGRPLIHGR